MLHKMRQQVNSANLQRELPSAISSTVRSLSTLLSKRGKPNRIIQLHALVVHHAGRIPHLMPAYILVLLKHKAMLAA